MKKQASTKTHAPPTTRDEILYLQTVRSLAGIFKNQLNLYASRVPDSISKDHKVEVLTLAVLREVQSE